MKYLTYYGGSYVAKNQLEQDQIDLLHEKDRILIHSDEDLKVFQDEVIAGLHELNKKNSRCKPFKPFWSTCGHPDNDFFISGIRVVNFKIYAINKDMKELKP